MTNEPSKEEWLKLYDAALKFKAIEAWNWMYDDYLFGVQNPEDGEIGYCTVLGVLGEVFGLIVYMGQKGLKSYLTIASNPENIENNLYIQDCLSATYDDRKYIDKKDMAIIKKVGLKFKGKNAYPIFRRYKPNYYPWYLTGDECRFLTIALEQASNICMRAKDDESFLPDVLDTGYCLVRYFEDGKWKDKQVRLEDREGKREITIQTDELKLAGIKKKSVKSEGKWEMDFFVNPTMPVKEKERPYFPLLTFIVDNLSGHVFHVIMTEPSDYYQKIFDSFVEFIEKTGVMPQEIFVEKDAMQDILNPVSSILGIKLTKVKKCKMVREAQKGLLEFGRRGKS
jgi:hypothetical protein